MEPFGSFPIPLNSADEEEASLKGDKEELDIGIIEIDDEGRKEVEKERLAQYLVEHDDEGGHASIDSAKDKDDGSTESPRSSEKSSEDSEDDYESQEAADPSQKYFDLLMDSPYCDMYSRHENNITAQMNDLSQDYIPPVERFTKWTVAISAKINPLLRSEVWLHHMQWARRTALLPGDAEVVWDYTLLNGDCMAPVGQLLAIRSNSTAAVTELMDKEPLAVHRAVDWRFFTLKLADHENVTSYFTSPMVFVGLLSPSLKVAPGDWQTLTNASLAYHISAPAALSGITVAHYGTLHDPVTDAPAGVLCAFNCKTNLHSSRYMAQDPAVATKVFSKSILAPFNIQDIDGLHHSMPQKFHQVQTFGELHNEDPEDLLLKTLPIYPGLEGHTKENIDVLVALKQRNISYAYDRLSLTKFFGDEAINEVAREWDDDMLAIQRYKAVMDSEFFAVQPNPKAHKKLPTDTRFMVRFLELLANPKLSR